MLRNFTIFKESIWSWIQIDHGKSKQIAKPDDRELFEIAFRLGRVIIRSFE